MRHDEIGVSRLERCARRGGKARRDVLCDARRIGQGMQGTVRIARRIGGPDADAQRADIRGRNVVADEHLDRGERVVAAAVGDRKALRQLVAVSHPVTDGQLGLPDIAHQHAGLRLGCGGEGECAEEREQRRGGERPPGADEAAPRAGEARETRRPCGGGYGLRRRDGRPGGAAGGQAALAGRLAPAPEAQSCARRSALGARRSALGARRSALGARRSILRVAQTTSNHFAQFDTIAAPLPVRAS